jgi:hypothetical protein
MIVVVAQADAEAAMNLLDGDVFAVGEILPSEQRRVQIIE